MSQLNSEQTKQIRKETFLSHLTRQAINVCQKMKDDRKQYFTCLRSYAINFRRVFDQYQNVRWRGRLSMAVQTRPL